MLRIWHNLRINLRAWPRMGASLLLAEKLTKLPLAELGSLRGTCPNLLTSFW